MQVLVCTGPLLSVSVSAHACVHRHLWQSYEYICVYVCCHSSWWLNASFFPEVIPPPGPRTCSGAHFSLSQLRHGCERMGGGMHQSLFYPLEGWV